MVNPVEKFQRVLAENNLSVTHIKPAIRFIENGGIVIEEPQLQITYIDPIKEEQDATIKSAAEKVAEEAPKV